MPPSNSAIKSYTQPSCILQIIEPQSQFELHFDQLRHGEEKISLRGDRHQLASLHEALTTYVQNLLSSPDRFNTLFSLRSPAKDATLSFPLAENSIAPDVPTVTNHISKTTTPKGEIFLQQGSGLSHYLFLSGATPDGQAIVLTMLQLFDLATVLDEYAADVLTTPEFSHPRRTASTPSTTWASIAAMLLLGVGLTAVVVQMLNRSDQPQIAQTISPSPNSNLALKSSPTPQLSSPDTLPLPPVGTSNQLPTPSPLSGLSSTKTPLPGTTLPVPPTTGSIPSPPPVPTTKTTPNTSVPGISQVPLPKQPIGQPGSISIPESGTPEIGKITSLPTINPTVNIPTPPSQKTIPQPSAVPDRDISSATITPPNAQPTAQQRLIAALERQNSAAKQQTGSPRIPTSASEPKTTALISTPQTNQVKEYFAKNWEPPANLKQTLEYSIVLDVDGSIQRIEPLGKASRTYVDRSGMPLIGEPFVSPNPQGETPRIRVVLSPDGNVQTFVEPN